MTDFPFDIVGFDLDGTLLDTSADLTAAVNHALAFADRPLLTIEQVKTMIGGGGKHMLSQAMAATGGCSEDELQALHKILLAFYDAHLSVHTKPFRGVEAALDALENRGVTLAVVTNKSASRAVKLLDQLGMRDRFFCVIGGDTLGEGNAKPSPAPIHAMIARCGGGSAAFVGDSIYDIQASKNAGIANVAVSFGFLQQPVEELGADTVIDDFAELVPALERLR